MFLALEVTLELHTTHPHLIPLITNDKSIIILKVNFELKKHDFLLTVIRLY